MSVQAITWSLGRAPSLASQAVLFSLANHADDWGVTYVGQETIAGECSCRKATVSDNLKRLEEAGVIARVARRDARGHRTSDHVVLAPRWADRGQMHDADKRAREKHPAEVCDLAAQDTVGVSRPETQDAAGGEPTSARRIGLDTVGVPEPSGRTVRGSNGSDQQTTIQCADGWGDLPDEMATDAQALLAAKQKVSGRLVTEREMLIACSALAEFNLQLGREFSIGPHLPPIVERIRLHPSWAAAKHRRLVQSACRIRWWESNGSQHRLTPNVVYGPRSFENVVQDAAAEAAGRPIERSQGEGVLKRQIWPDGRSWDELTAGEQVNARKTMTMGIKPWLVREEAVPVASNGHSITSFLD